jgi:hypothetical protein
MTRPKTKTHFILRISSRLLSSRNSQVHVPDPAGLTPPLLRDAPLKEV